MDRDRCTLGFQKSFPILVMVRIVIFDFIFAVLHISPYVLPLQSYFHRKINVETVNDSNGKCRVRNSTKLIIAQFI